METCAAAYQTRVSQMTLGIHSLVQHANDIDVRIVDLVEDQMRSNGIFEMALSNIDRATLLVAAGQTLECGHNIRVIAVRLLQRLCFERVQPDIFEIGFCKR
jgi:hypothetical protein